MLFVDIEDFWCRNSTIIDDCYHTFLTNDGWKYVGYQGLASHGGTFGLIAAHRYGSDTLHPVYHPRRVLHVKSPQMKTQLFHMR